MLAEKHPHQVQRLDTLESYDVLDTPDETDFDDIVALASMICETPVSLISLVDDDRQWFKARLGFEPRETSLDKSVCSHAILEEDFLEINDMGTDPRTSDNPLHTDDPNVKFYAGANLIAPDGHSIGTLCVLDTKPRVLTDFQRQALKTLSRQVMTQLELRKKIKIEAALKSEMDHRVKNSLQTIASIIRLASREVTDADALNVLQLVDRRLGAVASLHSELMGQDGRPFIKISSYFERLRELLTAITPDNIDIEIIPIQGEMQAQKASAIGMIASEFVANSAKHAFPDGQAGQVTIRLTQEAGRNRVLECSDNGVGHTIAPSNSDENTGLGERLMSSAALQLGGEVDHVIGPDGAILKVSFTV